MTELPPGQRRLLRAILLAALILRVLYCWRFPQWGPGGGIPNNDWYETIAESLLRHGAILDPAGHATAVREPLYPMLLAGTYLLTGPSYRAAQALNCAFGVSTVWLVFAIGWRIFTRRAPLIAATIAAVYPQFLFYTSSLARETFQTFLLTLAVFLLLEACRRPSARAFAAAGAVSAACPLTNSVFLPAGLALAAGVWLLGRRRGRDDRRWAALYLAVFLGLYGLWPLRNAFRFGRFILGINGGGAHMYIGMIVPNDVAGTPGEVELMKTDAVSREAARHPEAERDRVYYRGALRFMRESPLRFGRVCLGSLVKLWRLYPYPRAYAYDTRLVQWVSLLSDGWIIPLGFAGMLLLDRREPEADLLYLPLVAVSFTYMLFWSIIRYRLPLMPYVILFCAHALDRACERLWPSGTESES